MSPPTNLHVLTQSHTLVASKKRAKRNQVKEVLFDEDARREFLTGFHKRKVAKAEAARKKAAEREKQERLETRREQRRMLKEQAAENAAQVEQAYGAILPDETEWTGISGTRSDSEREGHVEQEQEYADEEVLATVAVVEDFDPDALLHGPVPSDSQTRSPASPPHPSTSKSKSTATTSRLNSKAEASIREAENSSQKDQIRNQRRTESREKQTASTEG
ncbi:hypothetical protein AAF712_000202 [Marasmius tenuissimus]|uniref:Nucleolar protein 12 n=1 Tax=Marasmius tenuissimus TaxID=585030 RepID=A0ABR3AGJ5_9AGAR